MVVIGTRPEAIKMASVVSALKARHDIEYLVCSTGQHATMLTETLADLGYQADMDLGIMREAVTITDLTAEALRRLDTALVSYQPDWLLVQGDTTTALAGALAGSFRRIKVGHVEAGLRTGNRYSPFPEEVNRRLITVASSLHFAPTEIARQNLLREGVAEADIRVTGNPVVDTLIETCYRLNTEPLRTSLEKNFGWLARSGRRLVLVTGHRRENFGDGLEQICQALLKIAERKDVEIIYPVHLNPNVREPVRKLLGNAPHIHLIDPVPYTRFVYLMTQAHILLTDSGGIQEECTSIGRPTLVMRDTSERPEAMLAGTVKLVGTSAERILCEVNHLLNDSDAYNAMTSKVNPYGNGTAGRQIVEALFA